MFDNCDSEEIEWYKPKSSSQTLPIQETKAEMEDAETNTHYMEEEETQLNIKDLLVMNIGKEYDQKALAEFLPKAYALINDALSLRHDEIFDVLYEEELTDQVYNYQPLFKLSSIDQTMDANLKVSDVQCSNNGKVLSVAYFIDDHVGPCSHTSVINFYRLNTSNDIHNQSKTSKLNQMKQTASSSYSNKISLEVNSCIKCIDSHPLNNNLFVAGSYIGEVYLINISNHDDGKDMVEAISRIDSMFYKECIISVKWIKYEENIYVSFYIHI